VIHGQRGRLGKKEKIWQAARGKGGDKPIKREAMYVAKKAGGIVLCFRTVRSVRNLGDSGGTMQGKGGGEKDPLGGKHDGWQKAE